MGYKAKLCVAETEHVYYQFNLDELPGELQEMVKNDPDIQNVKTQNELTDWFCNLDNLTPHDTHFHNRDFRFKPATE